ncbi:MAG: ATP-binding protein [Pelosinus sp.]|nr:ATP-binding protein [Pelosinus sp.]
MLEIHNQLQTLVIYRHLLQDKLIKELQLILAGQKELQYEFCSSLIEKAEQLGLSGDLLPNYIKYLIAHDENVFSLASEKTLGQPSASLRTAAIYDLTILKQLLSLDLSAYLDTRFIKDFVPTVPWQGQELYYAPFDNSTASDIAENLAHHYAKHGCGYMAGFAAFRWNLDSGLTGIKHFDPIRLEDLVGYERQKSTLIKNTKAFLLGKPANNVLLYGSRGTGKSSSVKALVNNYFEQGLRLVEVTKQDLKHLAKIMDILREHGQKFLIFLDDLSFEDFEVEYKYLKSVIEGGVEACPNNVLIYVTSNRRHLIKETWSDRSDNSDEIHRLDTVNEKVSLSDRFGITLSYLAPNQTEYLTIVEELAKKQQVSISPEELRAEALKWEMAHSGRSGRAAQQFINYLLGN